MHLIWTARLKRFGCLTCMEYIFLPKILLSCILFVLVLVFYLFVYLSRKYFPEWHIVSCLDIDSVTVIVAVTFDCVCMWINAPLIFRYGQCSPITGHGVSKKKKCLKRVYFYFNYKLSFSIKGSNQFQIPDIFILKPQTRDRKNGVV